MVRRSAPVPASGLDLQTALFFLSLFFFSSLPKAEILNAKISKYACVCFVNWLSYAGLSYTHTRAGYSAIPRVSAVRPCYNPLTPWLRQGGHPLNIKQAQNTPNLCTMYTRPSFRFVCTLKSIKLSESGVRYTSFLERRGAALVVHCAC